MDGTDSSPGIDYPALMRAALIDVVRKVLARAAEQGLPGEHHLYLTFGTQDDGVELPAGLRRQYPDEITIVLQHQFWNLAVEEPGFAVTLRFGGKPERIVVPWTALRRFADPSAEFGFRLQPPRDPAESEPEPTAPAPSEPASPPAPDANEPGSEATDATRVVDFDAFRRRPRADPGR